METEPAVELRDVVKQFGRGVLAVDGLSLNVARGQIFGLVGPNGAGKTTTLRMLLGLMAPTSGTVRVLGGLPSDPAVLRRVGSMGEAEFYPFLSGRDNLRVAARRCSLPDRRVDEVLEVAGLRQRGGDRVGGYSLGMKQRLGVALALLKDPELFVLDEPTNGLDPAGQLDMQRLIRELGAGGRTVILSSHDMDEVEVLCTEVAVIDGGRVLTKGAPLSLRGQPSLWVRAEPSAEAVALLAAIPEVEQVRVAQSPRVLHVGLREPAPRSAARLNRHLVQAGLDVSELRTERRSLREVFLELTGRHPGGSGSLPPSRRRGPRGGPSSED
jgi:ABC-type multidrug transport system ATPase subunit